MLYDISCSPSLCGPSPVGSQSVRVATVKPMADINPDTAEETARQLLDTRITATERADTASDTATA